MTRRPWRIYEKSNRLRLESESEVSGRNELANVTIAAKNKPPGKMPSSSTDWNLSVYEIESNYFACLKAVPLKSF